MLTKDDCALCMKSKEIVIWKGGRYVISAVMVKKDVVDLGDGRYTVGSDVRHMCDLLSRDGGPSVTVPCAEIMTEGQAAGVYL